MSASVNEQCMCQTVLKIDILLDLQLPYFVLDRILRNTMMLFF